MANNLKRVIGLRSAVLIGLGSILGTGIFVSTGLAAGIAGPAVLVAILIAGLLALCNGLNSAQLAASTPLSGGTYEYGYRYLNPSLGFTAGWMFLLAKSASAATAALGFSGYLLNLFSVTSAVLNVAVALVTVLVITLLVLSGIKRSSEANFIIVSVTVSALLFFIVAGVYHLSTTGFNNFRPFFAINADPGGTIQRMLHATALVFVAFTGYGRIATLGEEVHNPRQTIPAAVLITLVVTFLLYSLVTAVAIGTLGSQATAMISRETAAPLQAAAGRFGIPGAGLVLAAGAVTAMAGVMINLILGLSRVMLAMGRRGDLPSVLARINRSGTSPYLSVTLTGVLIAVLVLVGDVYLTWSFSAFTVLIYYAITNLSALQLRESDRLYARLISWIGLLSCLLLAFQVDREVWLWGIGLIVAGLLWKKLADWLGKTGQ